jgi:hypothetical protein
VDLELPYLVLLLLLFHQKYQYQFNLLGHLQLAQQDFMEVEVVEL